RGFRIELGEIEHALRQHPEVHDALAVLRDTAPGGPQLAAYVVGVSGKLPDVDLDVFLRERLPVYMIPAVFVVLSEGPLTSGGKIDRQVLPAQENPQASAERSTTPRNNLELHLFKIWEDLLQRTVGIHDNFFEAGGHSLLAAQLIDRVEKVFNRR